MTVYLLYYDTDTGSRDDWNTFHTPCEAFSTPELRDARQTTLEENDSTLEFHHEDLVVDDEKVAS